MVKYEIDLLVRGSLSEDEAFSSIKELIDLIKKEKNFKQDNWGNRLMAYRIKKETNAYYYIFTFESDKTENIEEFRRLANINDKVLRCLIINITKSYGYNASVNPKKIAKAEIAHKKYLKYQEEWKQKNSITSASSILDINSLVEEEDVIENE